MRHLTGWVWALALVGCGGAGASSVSQFDGKTVAEEQPLYTQVRSMKAHDLVPPTTDVGHLARDNAAFGADLYKASAISGTGNTLVSPYSVSLTMAMLYNGSAPDTAAEIATAMHFTLPKDRLNAAFDATDIALQAQAGERTLDVASSLWARPDGVSSDYLDVLSASYDTGIFTSNIATDPDGTRKAINQWTAKRTNQKITELLPPKSIGGDADGLRTDLVLVNAIDFEARWSTAFSATGTAPGDFKGLDGVVFQTPTMHGGAASAHAAGPDYDAYELSYGGAASLVLIVPQDGKFASVEAKLSGDFVASVFGALTASPYSVSMPSFSIHTAAPLDTVLKSLGVHRAFVRGANFPGILGVAATEINSAFQTAQIDVKEDGTKAVAATAVVVGSYPTAAVKPPPSVAIASPFVFVVRDASTNTVLFMGRVTDPR